MSLQPVKTSISYGVPVWQNIFEQAQGGFTLYTTNLTSGDVLKKGAPFGFDEATRVAKVIKTAKLHADAGNTDTTYQVKKGHQFKVGDYLAQVVGGKAYAIIAIDTSNTAYDVLTVGTTLAVALTAANGVYLFQSSATGASAAALYVTPKGLLSEDVEVGKDDSVGIVLRGTIYERRFANGYPSEVKSALSNIIFSQSY